MPCSDTSNIPFYDEIRSNGRTRPKYQRFLAEQALQTRWTTEKVFRDAKRAFHGDADVLPIPIVFSEKEYLKLSLGTVQRGKALHSFLYDHYFGEKKYLQYPAFRALPLEDILQRSFEDLSGKSIHPSTLQFWYAPDVVRDARGNLRVIEDNTGFIGGFGDVTALAEAASILSADQFNLKNRSSFYDELVDFYKTQAELVGGGKVILLSYSPNIRVTHEDHRLASALSPLGVDHVTQLNTLSLNNQGLFHRGKRVGFVILNRDTADIDPLDQLSFPRYLANGISELSGKKQSTYRKLLQPENLDSLHKKLARMTAVNVHSANEVEQLPGFWAAAGQGRFGVSYSPGFEFVNDKEFYPCVELLIHIYLKEAPILKNIPVVGLRLRNNRTQVFKNIKSWVIKGVSGRGGEEVWIGNRLSPVEVKTLRDRIAEHPSRYIAQRYIELSRINDHSVDMRALSMIATDRQIVSPIPWARAIPISQSGKVNISSGGLVTATHVIANDEIE